MTKMKQTTKKLNLKTWTVTRHQEVEMAHYSPERSNHQTDQNKKKPDKALTDTSKFVFGLTFQPLSYGVCECFVRVFSQRDAFQKKTDQMCRNDKPRGRRPLDVH